MNAKYTMVLILLCVSFTLPSFAYTPNVGDKLSLESIERKTKPLLKALPVTNLPYVRKQVQIYTGGGRYGAELILGRTPLYFPVIQSELAKRKMPAELRYLPIVESHLNPRARSHRGAVGLWQLMPRTARVLGLSIGSQVDERRDVALATSAALDYLESLHKKYGNWALAVSAYNCGTPNMDRAIRMAGSKDYLKVVHFLPKETREYLPRIAAVAYLVNYYQLHKLSPRYPDIELLDTETVTITESQSFSQLAQSTGVSLEHIRRLNPKFVNGHIPANTKACEVILPKVVNKNTLEASL